MEEGRRGLVARTDIRTLRSFIFLLFILLLLYVRTYLILISWAFYTIAFLRVLSDVLRVESIHIYD